jgi:hypothetical protein
MLRAAFLLGLTTMSLLVAGCGNDGERSFADDRPSHERDRGILDETQVLTFNRAVADYNGSITAWQAKVPACRLQTRSLLRRRAPATRVLGCHLQSSARVVRSVRALHRTVDGFEGEWNTECGDALDSTRTFMSGYDRAWSRVLADWRSLARDRRANLDADLKVAYRLALGIGRLQLPRVHQACMEAPDVVEGRRLAQLAADESSR